VNQIKADEVLSKTEAAAAAIAELEAEVMKNTLVPEKPITF